MGRAAACPRDRVPLRSRGCVRTAGAGVDVEHKTVDREGAQGSRSLRRLEGELRQHLSQKVVAGAVVLGNRQIGRKRVNVVHSVPHTFIAVSAYTSAVFTSPSMSRFSPSSGSGRPLEVP